VGDDVLAGDLNDLNAQVDPHHLLNEGDQQDESWALDLLKRPRVNTTARSYSRRMRTEALRQTTTTKSTKIAKETSMENTIAGPSSDWSLPSAQSTLGVVTIEAARGFRAEAGA
jgi:hypothetical protein